MAQIDEVLVQALEHALDGRSDEALALLGARSEPAAGRFAALLAQRGVRERERASALQKMRHDLGNALAIAQASLEAMIDGVVEITDARLDRVRDILAAVSVSMHELTGPDASPPAREPPGGGRDSVAEEVASLAPLAQTKGIRLGYACVHELAVRSNDAQTMESLRTMLLIAVRRTPCGGAVELRRSTGNAVELRVASAVAAHVLDASRLRARLLDDDGSSATLLIALGG